MGRYKSKPKQIEALYFDGTNERATEIIDWVLAQGGAAGFMCGSKCCDGKRVINIMTLEGTMGAPEGWWVIRGIKGEFYPCEDDIFQKSYEEIDDRVEK